MPDVFVDGPDDQPQMQRMLQPIDGDPAPTPGVDAPPAVKAPSKWWVVFVVAAVIIAVGILL
jgi:hypothetical protein